MMLDKLNRYIGVFALVLTLFLPACATTLGTAAKVDISSTEATPVIEVANKALEKRFKIKSFKNRMVNDLLNVQVEIANDFSSTQQFQYRFSWYDASGFEIEKEAGSWQPIVMHGRAVTTLQAVAPNPAAKSYKIVLRQQ